MWETRQCVDELYGFQTTCGGLFNHKTSHSRVAIKRSRHPGPNKAVCAQDFGGLALAIVSFLLSSLSPP
jgi:hypothetical protein